MLEGRARITAIDAEGRNFIDDVGEGDLWYFPPGIPHSIQGLEPDGCEFLLVFDDGNFSEDNTFLLTDWFKHMPPEVLAKNFGVPESSVRATRRDRASSTSSRRRCRARSPPTGSPAPRPVPHTFSHRLLAQEPIRTRGGTVRIVDSRNFPAAIDDRGGARRDRARRHARAALAPEHGRVAVLHRGPGAHDRLRRVRDARTFDYQAGDVGFVPFAMGHYIENTGDTPLRFLEMFRSGYYADVSLNRWMALTPPELVQGTLEIDRSVVSALRKGPAPVVPV